MTPEDVRFRSQFSSQFGGSAIQRELDGAVAALNAPSPLSKRRDAEALLKSAAFDLAKIRRVASAVERALAEIQTGLALHRAVEIERESATIN